MPGLPPEDRKVLDDALAAAQKALAGVESHGKILAAIDARLDRIERRVLRQIVDEAGVVYLFDGTQCMWVRDEPWRLALAAAFSFGAPERWSRAEIEKIPLVGPPPP